MVKTGCVSNVSESEHAVKKQTINTIQFTFGNYCLESGMYNKALFESLLLQKNK